MLVSVSTPFKSLCPRAERIAGARAPLSSHRELNRYSPSKRFVVKKIIALDSNRNFALILRRKGPQPLPSRTGDCGCAFEALALSLGCLLALPDGRCDPSGRCSYERPLRGTVTGTMRSMCRADAGCLVIDYRSLLQGRVLHRLPLRERGHFFRQEWRHLRRIVLLLGRGSGCRIQA